MVPSKQMYTKKISINHCYEETKSCTGCIPGEHSPSLHWGLKHFQNQFSVIHQTASSTGVLESPVGSDSSVSLPDVALLRQGGGRLPQKPAGTLNPGFS